MGKEVEAGGGKLISIKLQFHYCCFPLYFFSFCLFQPSKTYKHIWIFSWWILRDRDLQHFIFIDGWNFLKVVPSTWFFFLCWQNLKMWCFLLCFQLWYIFLIFGNKNYQTGEWMGNLRYQNWYISWNSQWTSHHYFLFNLMVCNGGLEENYSYCSQNPFQIRRKLSSEAK